MKFRPHDGALGISVAEDSTADAAGRGANSITVSDLMFSPMTLKVAPDAVIKVTNKDSVAHTVSAADGRFNTGSIKDSHPKKFTAPLKPGRYTFICDIHQFMTETLIVK